jgi:hypothetical protein
MPTFQVYSQIYDLFQGCGVEIKEIPPRQIGEVFIDKFYSWRFFMGSSKALLIFVVLEISFFI